MSYRRAGRESLASCVDDGHRYAAASLRCVMSAPVTSAPMLNVIRHDVDDEIARCRERMFEKIRAATLRLTAAERRRELRDASDARYVMALLRREMAMEYERMRL